jgi:hypothetical protein
MILLDPREEPLNLKTLGRSDQLFDYTYRKKTGSNIRHIIEGAQH